MNDGALRHLVLHNHEGRPEVRRHVRRAVGIYRSLRAAEVIETLPRPDIDGRLVRVNVDLQAEFNLTQALSPFVLDAVDVLDPDDPGYSLDVLSIVESVLEQPMTILLRQREMARTALVSCTASPGRWALTGWRSTVPKSAPTGSATSMCSICSTGWAGRSRAKTGSSASKTG